ncbi:pyridoxal phosphate-dependent transferase [Globomyces pollinis-pini]|nr:pyridoxal phosphate-dependent transferase [Globomyces pollinis-pini]
MNVDEGFEDEDILLDYHFNYGLKSGTQTVSPANNNNLPDLNSESIASFNKRRPSLPCIESNGRRESYRDQDSVLHYFQATNQSEAMLDTYITRLIQTFLNHPSPINAVDKSKELSDYVADVKIPKVSNTTDNLQNYLLNLKSNIIDQATKTASPQMIGHMTAALPYFHRSISRLLTALNQNVVKVETASTFTALERQTIAMLHNSFYGRHPTFYDSYAQSPEASLGMICSGGTIANITAMWIARNKALCPNLANGCDGIAKVGLLKSMQQYGYKSAVVIGSQMMHYSFKKAVDLLGLGEDGLCLIPTDSAFKMRIDLLKKKVEEFKNANVLIIAIVGIAGTTETGTIDPLDQIAQIGLSHGIHVHVDAAWGGPLIFSPDHTHKLKGIELADSITIDGHKQLYTPMGLGVVLLKCPTSASFIRKTAAYVIRSDSPDLGKFTLEGSRPANALYLHASLNLLGRDGLAILMTRSCTLVKQMYVRVMDHPTRAFQVLHEPQTNILLYRYLPTKLRNKNQFTNQENDLLNEYVKRIQTIQSNRKDGQPHGFTSRTSVIFESRWTNAFRIVISNALTQWEDIENTINDHIEVGHQVEIEMNRQDFIHRIQSQYPVEVDGFWVGWPYDI